MTKRRIIRLIASVMALILFASSALAAGYTTLRYRDEGDAVRQMQTALNSLGYTTGGTDGKFGPATEKAVRQFQQNNGLKVERYYDLPLTKYRMGQEGTYDRLLDELVNSEAMKAKRLHAGDSRFTIQGGDLYLEASLEASGGYFDLSSREAADLLTAVAQDAAAGTWGDFDWFDQNQNVAYALSLELSFTYPNDYGGDSYDWINITVRPGMDNTVACLKELGLVTDKDLVTREQMEKINGWNTSETETYEEKMTQEASLGVIGGADGPTAIVVTEVG